MTFHCNLKVFNCTRSVCIKRSHFVRSFIHKIKSNCVYLKPINLSCFNLTTCELHFFSPFIPHYLLVMNSSEREKKKRKTFSFVSFQLDVDLSAACRKSGIPRGMRSTTKNCVKLKYAETFFACSWFA